MMVGSPSLAKARPEPLASGRFRVTGRERELVARSVPSHVTRRRDAFVIEANNRGLCLLSVVVGPDGRMVCTSNARELLELADQPLDSAVSPVAIAIEVGTCRLKM
jgi:hypothetical protein